MNFAYMCFTHYLSILKEWQLSSPDILIFNYFSVMNLSQINIDVLNIIPIFDYFYMGRQFFADMKLKNYKTKTSFVGPKG